VRAGPITNRILTAPVDPGPSPDMARIESAALLVLGCDAVFDSVYLFAKISLYRALLAEAPYGRNAPMLPECFGRLCAAAVKFAVGLCAILFSRGIVALKNGCSACAAHCTKSNHRQRWRSASRFSASQ